MATRVVLSKTLQARYITILRRHVAVRGLWEGGPDEEDELDPQSKDRIRSVNYKLKGLVMCGHHNKAVEYWKSYRSDINNTPFSSSTYEILMSMDHSIQTVEALREDMTKLGVVMSGRCGLGYVRLLLDINGGRVDHVMKFIENDLVLRGSPWFIGCVMDCLSDRGFPQSALDLSQLYIPTTVIPHEDTLVVASKVRAYGHLGNLDTAREFVSEHYSSSTDIPIPVRLALIDALCLTDHPNDAYTELITIQSYGLQNIAYLVESVVRATGSHDDCGLALDVYRDTWDTVRESLCVGNDVSVEVNMKKELLRRIYNGMMTLQMSLIAQGNNSDQIKEFISHNFYSEMRSSHIQPNEDTYKVVLRYSCYDSVRGLKWAENAIKRMISVNKPPSCDAIISWCREGTCLDPDTVIKMVSLVRLHCHMTDQTLELKHFKKILNTHRKSLTVKTVKIIMNMMIESGVLEGDVIACNTILKALHDTNDLGATFTFFRDLREVYSVSPNIETYHILMDSVIQDGSHRGCYGAIYKTWRMLLASKVVPDIDIIYKFIHCCRIAKDYSRAFYFFRMIEDYGFLPDENILHELIQMCQEMNDDATMNEIRTLAVNLYPEKSSQYNNVLYSHHK